MSTVSVVMTPYNRGLLLRNTLQTYQWQTRKPDQIVVVEDGFDGGRTMEVCAEAREWGLPVEYFCRRNRPNIPYSNSAIPRNIGIKKATGEILVMQNGEVRFTKATDFANIVGPTEENEWISCVAPCLEIKEDGSHGIWFCDPNLWNYNHFCEAFRTAHLMAVGGFDEAYRGYGREDHDLNWRLNRLGVICQWAKDVVTEHQWHLVMPSPLDAENDRINYEYGGKQIEDFKNGLRGLESNIGKDWGNPAS